MTTKLFFLVGGGALLLSITPDQITAAATAIALVLTALGGLLATILTAVRKIKKDVEAVVVQTDGVAHRQEADKKELEEKLERSEERLAAAVADKLETAWLAKEAARLSEQAAADVRSATATPTPPPTQKPEDGE